MQDQSYPIPGMPYRLDWNAFHPHNVAHREASRRKAQDRAHDRRVKREAERAARRAADAVAMASPEMVARKAAALAGAERLMALMQAGAL
ncbi:hypothetical protein WKW79_20520 [Variovorax robiniae]|uniref:ABC transporter ATP-binding protein n=1 Tax=Variovorax robiniae TaxID=1836199 RepID=A0ABU8XE79_9BURK